MRLLWALRLVDEIFLRRLLIVFLDKRVWAVVGELSIYEFLGLVLEDPMVQPSSRALLRLHALDEAAHGSLIAQIVRDNFHNLSEKQQACFVKCLPLAMVGFSEEDWLVWYDVLELAGVTAARKIISDTESDSVIPGILPSQFSEN
jgi:hypothetical protein